MKLIFPVSIECINQCTYLCFIVFGDEFYRLWVPGKRELSTFIIYYYDGTLSNKWFYQCIVLCEYYLNKVKLPSIMLFVSGVLNVVLVFILMNFTNLGLLAIPISSSTLSVLRNIIFTPIYPARYLGIKWNTFYSLILRNIITTFILVCLYSLIKSFIHFDQWLDFILVAIGCGMVGYIISLVTTLNSREFMKFKKLIALKLLRKKNLQETI